MAAKVPGNGPSIPERFTISETEADAWGRDDCCQARGGRKADRGIQEAQRMMLHQTTGDADRRISLHLWVASAMRTNRDSARQPCAQRMLHGMLQCHVA